jgi:hypothetical protein
VTAQHSFGLSLWYLRELLADSELWQALVRTPDATYDQLLDTIAISPSVLDRPAALKAIAVGMFPTDQDNCDNVMPVPRMLIRYDTDGVFTRESGTWRRNQTILLLIETPVPVHWRMADVEAFSSQEIDGQDKVGRILTDCNSVIKALTAERLQVESWTFGPTGLVAPEDAGGEWLRSAEIHCSFIGAC